MFPFISHIAVEDGPFFAFLMSIPAFNRPSAPFAIESVADNAICADRTACVPSDRLRRRVKARANPHQTRSVKKLMAARNAGNVVPFSIGPSGRNGRKSKKTAAKIIGHIRLLSFARSDDGVLFIELEFKSGRKQKCRFFRLDDVSVHSRQFNQLNLAGARLFSSAVRNEFIARI